MKLVKILSVFAVFAAAGMVAAGCDSPAGVGNGYDEAVSAEEAGGAGGTPALSEAGTKEIKVRFEVLNGGWGLGGHDTIVLTQNDGYLGWYQKQCSMDFTAAITVPAGNEYLNVRWRGSDFWCRNTYLKAKMKPESAAVTIDYNGQGKVATKNLYDVSVTTDPNEFNKAVSALSDNR